MQVWYEEVRLLTEQAKEALESAIGAPSSFEAQCLQHHAIVCLMQAVEIHNDNFRFKVTENGKATT